MKKFKDLNAKQRRNIILGGVIALFLVAAFELSRPGVLTTTAPPVSATNLLGSADPHQLGQASINRQIVQLQANNGALATRVAQMQSQLQDQEKADKSGSLPTVGVLPTRQPGTSLSGATPTPDVPTVSNGHINAPPSGYTPTASTSAGNGTDGMPDGSVTGGAPAIQTWGEMVPVKKGANGYGVASTNGGATPVEANTNSEEPTDGASPAPGSKPAKKPEIYIPAGTMLTGVLLTGVDAPTGRDASSHPIPVLVRIKEDAILPNEYRADYRECFIVASAMGDLSSERAYLRGQTLSCVSHDGGVIQSSLQMWGTGEDGKAGMRGTLVSKQGSILAKAMLAGFASGLGRAFTPQTSTITSNSSGVTTVPVGTAGRMAAFGGISSASDQIASYYLQMADSEFPVIEISAGRPVTFIVEKGAELSKLESTSDH